MSDNYHLLKHELLKDYWKLKDALYILSGWVEVDTDPDRLGNVGERYTKFVPITKTKLKKPDRRLYKSLLDLWNATDHELVEDDQRNYNMYSERQEYRVTYILKWCKKKQVEVPWFDWAVEEGLIDPLDVTQGYPSHGVTDNGNTGANRMPENEPMGAKKEENLLRLIYIFKDMLLDKSIKKHFPFTDQEAIAEYIHNNFNEQLPVKRLSAKGVQATLADANKVKSKDNHTD